MIMRTFKGHLLDLANPSTWTIDTEDIAHHLAMTCRWGGAVQSHYSVAEHSWRAWLLARHYSRSTRVWALLHDAHEAYTGDIITPVKALLQGILPLQVALDAAIVRRFNLVVTSEDREVVGRIDHDLMEREYEELFSEPIRPSLTAAGAEKVMLAAMRHEGLL